MTLESAFYMELSGDQTLVGLAGDQIMPSHGSEGAEPPFVVYTPVNVEPRYDLDGQTALTRARMQVDCYAETPDEAAALAAAVIAAIPQSGWPLHRTGHTEQDLGLEDGTRLFRRLLEFSIVHRST